MSQNEIPNIDIDELLNSFIDGELDARHQTEVQRLIKHDKKIAKRLLELQKCKRLVSSLPYAEAPKKVLKGIKAALKEKSSLEPALSWQRTDKYEGARHLLVRRLVAAAAMFVLVAVFGAVIYWILAPQTATDRPFAFEQPKEPAVIVATAEKPMEFNGRLELKTSSPSEVIAFINRAIERNIPSDEWTAAVPGELGESHALNCSRQSLRLLLADLGDIWDKFDSATLFVDTDQPEGQVVIDAVAAEQVVEIINQDDFETQIKIARYFAALNNMAERAPGKEVLTAIDDSGPALLTIPKPVLTSSEKPAKEQPARAEDEQKIHLTITLNSR